MDKFNSLLAEKSFVADAVNTIQYEWLLEHLNTKYDKKKYREYVINYLILNYCCRNSDTDCVILTEADLDGTDDEELLKENYLVLLPNGSINWVRSNYKTRFDVPTYNITDEKFIHSVKELHDASCFVFHNGEERIHRRSLGRVILNSTYNCLGQEIIFKIVKRHFQNDHQKLLALSQSRPCHIRNMI